MVKLPSCAEACSVLSAVTQSLCPCFQELVELLLTFVFQNSVRVWLLIPRNAVVVSALCCPLCRPLLCSSSQHLALLWAFCRNVEQIIHVPLKFSVPLLGKESEAGMASSAGCFASVELGSLSPSHSFSVGALSGSTAMSLHGWCSVRGLPLWGCCSAQGLVSFALRQKVLLVQGQLSQRC